MSSFELLHPIENEYRRKLSLDGLWDIAFGREDTSGWELKLPKEHRVAVPGCVADIFRNTEKRTFSGEVWYEKEFYLQKNWLGEETFLCLHGCAQQGIIYVNGHCVGATRSSLGKSVFEVTKSLRYGEKNRITIKVRNTLNISTFPIGKTIQLGKGICKNISNSDSFNWWGLYDSVELFSLPTTRILNVSIDIVEASKEKPAIVHYKAQVQGNCLVTATLRNREGTVVATAVGGNATLTVEKPHLWSIGDGYLYQLELEVSRLGKQSDAYTLPIGIRSFTLKDKRFFLNNEEVYLKGIVWHGEECFGKSLESLQRDLLLVQGTGANVIRGGGIPFSEDVLRLADEMGIMVLQDVGGKGLHNREGLWAVDSFFNPVEIRQRTLPNHLAMAKNIYERDKNHPSLIMWNVAENPDSADEGAASYLEEILCALRSWDGGQRPVSFTMGLANYETENATQLGDVIFLNRFDMAKLDELQEKVYKELIYWSAKTPNKPVVFTSCGKADSLYEGTGLNGLSSQEAYLHTLHRVFDMMPHVQGEFLWNFIDYEQGEAFHPIQQGLVDQGRHMRPLYRTIQKRWCRGQRKQDLGQIF